MKILGFNQHSTLEPTKKLKENQIINLQFIDREETSNISCKLVEFGWGIDRSIIYYRFIVLKSDNKKYPISAEFILPIDFNEKEFTFLFYPYYNEEGSIRRMTELKYKAFCKML
jgi:hypothetical protein